MLLLLLLLFDQFFFGSNTLFMPVLLLSLFIGAVINYIFCILVILSIIITIDTLTDALIYPAYIHTIIVIIIIIYRVINH